MTAETGGSGGLNRFKGEGFANEFALPGNVPPYDTYQAPRNLEEWRKLAATSMHAIAEVGHAAHELLEAFGRTPDTHSSLSLPALGAAKVEYHEGSTEGGVGKGGQVFDAIPYRRIVKIKPIPRPPIPPTGGATWQQMQEGSDRYNREVAEDTEISWSSLEPDKILVSRRKPEATSQQEQWAQEGVPQAYLDLLQEKEGKTIIERGPFTASETEEAVAPTDIDERPLNDLDPDELVRFAEIVRGVAVAVATEARRADILHTITNIWGPDQEPKRPMQDA